VHEIKNPLSTIQINLQLMREDLAEVDAPKSRRALRRVQTLEREVERLTALLESYLQLARAGDMTLQPVNLNHLLDQLVDFVQADLRQQGNESLPYYNSDLPSVRGDPRRLKQALLNIIINARQAMPDGGQLILRTVHDPHRVTVEVTDTGTGIPADKLGRIFDAFYSSKKGGSGLGLATTKRIINAHGGAITVQSESGKGTLVRITLPLAAGTTGASRGEQSE